VPCCAGLPIDAGMLSLLIVVASAVAGAETKLAKFLTDMAAEATSSSSMVGGPEAVVAIGGGPVGASTWKGVGKAD
jgi:hypothetical protein